MKPSIPTPLRSHVTENAPSPAPISTITARAAKRAGLRVDFAIAGVSKSGSSFLHETLMANGAISMPAREVFELHSQHYDGSVFPKLAQELDHTKITGIKRPNLIFDLNALNRLRAVPGDTKIIIQMRDPVVRAISHFFHLRRYSQVRFASLDEMVEALIEGELGALGGKAYDIEAESRYADVIAQIRFLFGNDRVTLLSFEHMKAKPQSTADQVCDFIGAPPAPVPQLPSIPQKVIYADDWQKLWASSCQLEGICDEDGLVVAYRKRPLAANRQRRIDDIRHRAHDFYDSTKPSLTRQQRERLQIHFRDEYKFLEREGFTMTELDRLTTIA